MKDSQPGAVAIKPWLVLLYTEVAPAVRAPQVVPVANVVALLLANKISKLFGAVMVPADFCHSICVIIDPGGIEANSVAV